MSACDNTQNPILIKQYSSLASDKSTLVHNSGTNDLPNNHPKTTHSKTKPNFNICDNLTPRELQICEMLRIGFRRAQVAIKCGISPNTFDTHVRHIKFKSNLSSMRDLLRVLSTN